MTLSAYHIAMVVAFWPDFASQPAGKNRPIAATEVRSGNHQAIVVQYILRQRGTVMLEYCRCIITIPMLPFSSQVEKSA